MSLMRLPDSPAIGAKAHGLNTSCILVEPPTACRGGGFLLHRYSLPAKTCLCQAVTIGSTGVDFGQFLP